ncbi:MAG: hypothetical protein NTV86_17610 [Planctomycetota bacterium]|nr:hypothetical protein [Planctomycetota bacterium]
MKALMIGLLVCAVAAMIGCKEEPQQVSWIPPEGGVISTKEWEAIEEHIANQRSETRKWLAEHPDALQGLNFPAPPAPETRPE